MRALGKWFGGCWVLGNVKKPDITIMLDGAWLFYLGGSPLILVKPNTGENIRKSVGPLNVLKDTVVRLLRHCHMK